MNYDEMIKNLKQYNWDDGFEIPRQLLCDENCDLALALEIFYLGDGYRYLIDQECREERSGEWLEFISKLYRNIEAGHYKETGKSYHIPLSKVQRYQLSKSNISAIFITDL